MIDILAKVFVVYSVLIGTPNPQPNYGNLPTTEDTITDVMECVLDDTYKIHMDFNADCELNLADVVAISKRKTEVEQYNEITIDSELINELFEVNSIAPTYWEIDKINNDVVRQYEVITDKEITVDIYFELENGNGNVTLTINPNTETAYLDTIEIRGNKYE